MSGRIIPWKNTGEEGQEMRRLFKIQWNVEEGKYVPDLNGPHLGYFEKGGLEIRRYHPPEEPEKQTIGTEIPKIIFGTPTLGVVNEEEE